MDGKSTAAAAVSAKDLQESVNQWFEDTELLIFSLRKVLQVGLRQFPYCCGDFNPETAEEVRQHQQHLRKSIPETLKEQQRISRTLLNHLELTCDDERWKLLELAYASLKTDFSTGRYKSYPFAWLALQQVTQDLLMWVDDIAPFYGSAEGFDKKHSADFRKAQDCCPISAADLDNIEARLFTEKAQVLSILEQRQQLEVQQQMLQVLSRQPAVLPPVPVYIPTDTPAQAARLQYLHNIFRDIRSPKQLTDLMAELGCYIYQLCQEGLLTKHDILQQLGQAAEQSRIKRPGSRETADYCYSTLCIHAVDIFSSRDRILLRPVAADVTQTDWSNDYAEQGCRFALFILELLGQIKPVEQEPKPLSVTELEAEVTKVVTNYGKDQYINAKKIATTIKESGRQTSVSQVKKTKSWKFYVQLNGKQRNPVATITNTDSLLDNLVDEKRNVQGSKGRRNRKPVNRSDD